MGAVGRARPGGFPVLGGRRREVAAARFQHLLFLLPGEIRASENSYFCQAARQLASVPSSQLCVKLASGGDPTYAFNIRFTGEEVHGTSKWAQASSGWRPCVECEIPGVTVKQPISSPLARGKPHTRYPALHRSQDCPRVTSGPMFSKPSPPGLAPVLWGVVPLLVWDFSFEPCRLRDPVSDQC